ATPAASATPATPAPPGKALEDRSTVRLWCVLALLTGGALLAAMGSNGKVSVMGLLGVALLVVGGFSGWQALRAKPGERAWSFGMMAVWLLAGATLAGLGFARPLGTD